MFERYSFCFPPKLRRTGLFWGLFIPCMLALRLIPLPPVNVSTAPTPSPSTTYEAITNIKIDGLPLDWAKYDFLIRDEKGDNRDGNFDIANVGAFINDEFIFLLITTYKPPSEYVQIDLEVISGEERRFIVSSPHSQYGSVFLGEIINNKFNFIGEVAESEYTSGEVVEFKVPLEALGNAQKLTLVDVRPMGGECCEEKWRVIDRVYSVSVPEMKETEATEDHSEDVADEIKEKKARVCAEIYLSLAAVETLKAAPVRLAKPGYKAEWFVEPTVFNMPQEVLRTPKGEMFVLNVRSATLFRLSRENKAKPFLTEIYAYLGDVDTQGNIYLHGHPWGIIYRISPNGGKSVVVQSPELHSACDSGFGVGADGNLYLARSRCQDKSDLLQITPKGENKVVAEVPQLQALRSAPDGRFLAASYDQVYQLSLRDYSLKPLGRNPGKDGISPGGLAVDEKGNIYFSTGSRRSEGEVYKLEPGGKVTLLAKIAQNGISGIEWLPETGEIIGGQLRQGGLIAVAQDGGVREIIPGNGLVSPMGMAFSPCGELAVANDDGGMMALVNQQGAVAWFMDYISFTPPIPCVAFAPDGTMYASEGAPGLKPEGIAIVPPGGEKRTLVDAAMPCGIVRRTDGTLLIAETSAGRITQVKEDGSTFPLVEGLKYPQVLALAGDGSLYASVGGKPGEGVFTTPLGGDTVVNITSQGRVNTVAKINDVSAIAVSAEGGVFAAGADKIVQISSKGNVSSLASGFKEVRGLAFDLAGNLYVSDTALNGIVRISGFPQGRLAGAVMNASRKPIEGARVQILIEATSVVGRVVLTDRNGKYSVPAAPAIYSVSVSANGYETETISGVQIIKGKETTVEVLLR